MKKIAIIPGSYDPVTLGHVDIIRRASLIFDEIIPAIMVNSEKKGLFTSDERLTLLRCACKKIKNARPLVWESLASELMENEGASFIVKGARNATDFDYENSLAEIMRRFAPDAETIILPCRSEFSHISSTYAREILKYGKDLSDIADKDTAVLMRSIYDAK
ncbi:MAG: pantetheine-phosphate adenylyltransferase [Clostridia bacterium]|nr:pantetheine-phosphate adenylyltransferase [Clostridia bacterium]